MSIAFSLSKKIQRFLLTYLLLILPAIAIGVVIYYAEMKTNKIALEIRATNNLQGQFELVLNEFKYIISDLSFLAEHNEIKALLESDNIQTRQNLAKEYLAIVTHKKIYDQARFLDQDGLEIARANFNNGNPFIVPEDKLQDKGSRYYFQDAFVLKRGEIFVSPFDLNVEGGKIELPLKPMLRFATPVFDNNDNKRGIVLLNYLGNHLLHKIRRLSSKNYYDIMLLNQQGFWLHSSSPDDEWGFMLEDRKDKTFGKRFPVEWEIINVDKNGQFYTDNGLFTFDTVYPLNSKSNIKINATKTSNTDTSEYYWKLISYIPSTVLTNSSKQIITNISLPFLGLIILMAIIALIITNILTKNAESKAFLQYSEEQLRLLIEGVVDYAIIMLDPQGRIISWNNGAKRILQYTADEIIGKNISIFHPEENIKEGKVEKILTTAIKEGKAEDEGYQIRKNGSRYWAHITLTALLKPDGTLRGFTSVTRDITEQKNAEENIRQSEMMFRALYESSGDAIFLFDENGIFDCNPLAVKTFGCNNKFDLISFHFADLSPPMQPNGENSRELADKYIQLTIKEQINSFEWTHSRLDNTNFQAEVLLNSLNFYDWPVLQAVVRDITERKKTEKKIELANKRIQELNKQLLSENQLMSAELEITRKLQQMMLPKERELSNIKNLDVAGFMSPAETVGGDYYDVLQYNGHVLFAIGDVTGHGLESGVLTVMVQTAVRTMLAHNENTDLPKFLNTLNNVIYNNVQRMNSDKNLTLTLLNYEPINSLTQSNLAEDIKGILYSSGQHETIIVARATGDMENIDTVDLGFPIGLEADISEWIAQVSIPLKAGDVVVLYTDGITEAENCNKELYGLEQLYKIIKQNRHLGAEDIRYNIVYDVLKFIDEQEIYDDITLLVFKQK
ncbi:MAG TPA: PAS domain S-box protein [Thioploca sp.]|nr:PAS domain S-box protein [Thioploca sp.]